MYIELSAEKRKHTLAHQEFFLLFFHRSKQKRSARKRRYNTCITVGKERATRRYSNELVCWVPIMSVGINDDDNNEASSKYRFQIEKQS